jgi:hypothetical protein
LWGINASISHMIPQLPFCRCIVKRTVTGRSVTSKRFAGPQVILYSRVSWEICTVPVIIDHQPWLLGAFAPNNRRR